MLKNRNRSGRQTALRKQREGRMRGDDKHPDGIFSYRRPEERILAAHPLRPIRAMLDTSLRELSPEFARR
jgi:hypothetical protein